MVVLKKQLTNQLCNIGNGTFQSKKVSHPGDFFCVLLDDTSPAFLFFFSIPLFIIFYFFSLDFGILVVPKLFSKQFQKVNWKSQHTHLLENSLFLLNLLQSPCLELSEYLLFFFDIWQICVFPTIFDVCFVNSIYLNCEDL